MNPILRLASERMCGLLLTMLPEPKKMWARAIRAEANSIPDDMAAFLFTLDALRGFALLLLSEGCFARVAAIGRAFSHPDSRTRHMINRFFGSAKSWHVGAACAVGAVGFGLAYLFAAGAPMHMLAINAGTLIIGLAAVTVWNRMPGVPADGSRVAILVMALGLLATALNGLAVDGAARWVAIGPLAIQPSLILMPVIIMQFARDRGLAATIGVLIVALALALQPDRAMAGTLMCGMAVLAIANRDRFVLVALAGSATAFIVTLMLPDELPAVPYVDQIFFTAFDVHPLAGLAVAAGTILLLFPALHGLRSGSSDRTVSVVFAAIWLGIIVAAAIGNYPTPLVGYGGSAILGYLLSLGVLSRSTKAHIAMRAPGHVGKAPHVRDNRSLPAQHQLA